MGRNYVVKFVAFFDNLPSSVDIFHLIKVDIKLPSLPIPILVNAVFERPLT